MARRARLSRACDQLLLDANVLRESNEEGHQQPLHPAGHDGVFKERLTTYLIENKEAAGKIVEQVLINKRSRENAEKTRQSIKTNLQQKTDMANRVQKFIDCRSKDKGRREVYIVEGDSAAGAIRTSRDAEFQASCLFEAGFSTA